MVVPLAERFVAHASLVVRLARVGERDATRGLNPGQHPGEGIVLVDEFELQRATGIEHELDFLRRSIDGHTEATAKDAMLDIHQKRSIG
jgi:hypothetical protein